MTDFADLPLEDLNAVAVYAYADDPDVTIVEHVQDDQAEHGINTGAEMFGGPRC